MTAAERRRTVVVAGHCNDPETARRGLDDDDPKVRAGALGALERLGLLGDEVLATALTDPAVSVRRRAAQIAAHHQDVSLRDALDDPDASVIEMAAFACGEQERSEPSIVARLTALGADHPDPLVREAAVAALGAIGDPAGLATILHAAGHDKPAVRRRAVIALAPFDGPDVDAALRSALDDRDWQVRQVAEDLEAP